ncbi:MAG: siroheme decarboxylase subunit alpha [Syntrophorhabdaceae bacterium]
MDAIDKRILNLIQEEFPLVERPFAAIGEKLGITDKNVQDRILRLKTLGIIRRIGPVLDAKKIGYHSLLCASTVPPDLIDDVARTVNAEPSVTHNYERAGKLNLWFTVTMKNNRDIDDFIAGIEKRFSITIYRFPEKKTFKIKTRFLIPD